MTHSRPIHPDFQYFLDYKETPLVELFIDLRKYLIEICPESNELLYNTHALTAVFSLSEKLSDAFCHVPVYDQHLNLGFNEGTLLHDPNGLLQGTGKLIRHIPVKKPEDYRNIEVQKLIEEAITMVNDDMKKPSEMKSQTISKIKKLK